MVNQNSQTVKIKWGQIRWKNFRWTNTEQYISNRKLCCFSCMIAMLHQNSPTVEFQQEMIEGKLRRANTEPSVDFRKANTEPSVHFRRANAETYQKQNVNLSKRVGKDRVFLGLAWLLLRISLGLCPREISRSSHASPWKTPSFPPLLLSLTQPMHLRESNTNLSMHFRKAITDPSMHFRKANTKFWFPVLLPTLLTILLPSLLPFLPPF